MLIMFVGIFTVMILVGAVTIDFGLWFSERRGAQRDADLVSTAGAFAYLADLAAEVPPDTDQALNDARDWAIQNGVDPATIVFDDEACVAGSCILAGTGSGGEGCRELNDGMPWVEANIRHDSRAFFADVFRTLGGGPAEGAPDIGGHARACAGASHGEIHAIPFEIDAQTSLCFQAGEPVYTSLCGLEFGAGAPNPRGLLSLDNNPSDGYQCSDARGGASDIAFLIANGGLGQCLINEQTPQVCDPASNGPWLDCVATQGGTPREVLDGTNARITGDPPAENPGEPLCDGADANAIDDFDESVYAPFGLDPRGPEFTIYEARDCDPGTPGTQISPRLVTIIVLEEFPDGPSNQGYPIWALAGMRLVGCLVEDEPLPATEGGWTDEQRQCRQRGGGIGRVVVYGQFVNLIIPGGAIAPPVTGTTLFGISLVE